MTVNATNRIIDPKYEIRRQLREYEERKRWKKNNPRGFRGIWNLSYCSQCNRGMRKDIAKLQIENKRENAPICMACIMGYERKEKRNIKWKTETIKKFQQLGKHYHENKK